MKKTQENVDWESYTNELAYPEREGSEKEGKLFLIQYDIVNRAIIAPTSNHPVKVTYRGAVDAGRRSGHDRGALL